MGALVSRNGREDFEDNTSSSVAEQKAEKAAKEAKKAFEAKMQSQIEALLKDENKLGIKLHIGITEIDDKEETVDLDVVIAMHWEDKKFIDKDYEAKQANSLANKLIASNASESEMNSLHSRTAKFSKADSKVKSSKSFYIPDNKMGDTTHTGTVIARTGMERYEREPDDVKEEDKPKISFFNSPSQEPIYNSTWIDRKRGVICVYMNSIVKVWAHMDLHRFPYDRQVFDLTMGIYDYNLQQWFLEEEKRPNDKFSKPSATLYSTVTGWRLDKSRCEIKDKKHRVTARFYVSRNPDYYLYSIVFVTFLIGLFNLVIVAMDQADIAARVSFTLTLMLTTVAFKFVTMGFVPPTAYQTMLDWYTTCSFVFIGVSMVDSVLVTRLAHDSTLSNPEKAAYDTDWYYGVISCSVWTALHVAIVLVTNFEWGYESWQKVRSRVPESTTFVFKDFGKKPEFLKAEASDDIESNNDSNECFNCCKRGSIRSSVAPS